MPEAVSRRPVTSEAQIHIQVSSVGICSEQKWQWNSFPLSVSFYQFFILIHYFITDAMSYTLEHLAASLNITPTSNSNNLRMLYCMIPNGQVVIQSVDLLHQSNFLSYFPSAYQK